MTSKSQTICAQLSGCTFKTVSREAITSSNPGGWTRWTWAWLWWVDSRGLRSSVSQSACSVPTQHTSRVTNETDDLRHSKQKAEMGDDKKVKYYQARLRVVASSAFIWIPVRSAWVSPGHVACFILSKPWPLNLQIFLFWLLCQNFVDFSKVYWISIEKNWVGLLLK